MLSIGIRLVNYMRKQAARNLRAKVMVGVSAVVMAASYYLMPDFTAKNLLRDNYITDYDINDDGKDDHIVAIHSERGEFLAFIDRNSFDKRIKKSNYDDFQSDVKPIFLERQGRVYSLYAEEGTFKRIFAEGFSFEELNESITDGEIYLGFPGIESLALSNDHF